MKRNLNVYIVLILVLMLTSLFSFLLVSKWMYFTGDGLYTSIFSKNLAQYGTVKIPAIENKFIGSEPIIGLQSHGIYNYEVVPTLHIGLIVIGSIFFKLGIEWFLPVVFSMLIFVYFSKLYVLVINKNNILLYVTVLFLFFVATYMHLILIDNNVYGLTFMIISLFYFTSYLKKEKTPHLILFSIFISCTVLLRYELIIHATLLYFFVCLKLLKNKSYLDLVYMTLPIVIFATSLMVGFKHLYGSIFGYLKVPEILRNSSWFLRETNFEIFNMNNLILNISNSFFTLLGFLLVFYIIGFVIVLKNWKSNKILVFFLFLGLLNLLFYASNEWSTSREISYHDALIRYVQVYWLSCFLMVGKFFEILKNKKITIIIAFLLFINFFSISSEVLINQAENFDKGAVEEKSISMIVNSSDVVFAKNSKVVYPYAKTAIYQKYSYPERINKTYSSINSLLNNNINVFFYDQKFELEKQEYSLKEYFDFFEKNGLVVEQTPHKTLYKITLQNKTNTTTQTLKNATT